MEKIFLSSRQVENLSLTERAAYFDRVRETCLSMEAGKEKAVNRMLQKAVTRILPRMRRYDLEIKGTENIPKDDHVLFLCNHSNAHDLLTMLEAFEKIGCKITFLASNERLSPVIKKIFTACEGVLFDRDNKTSISKGVMTFCVNILNGRSGVIFGEATWNLHPCKPMQPIKAGAIHIAAITKIPIVPTFFEYVEKPYVCDREKEIYQKCVVQFTSPVNISETESLFAQTDRLQKIMEQKRISLWKELGRARNSLEDINKDVYLNHTYLKKFNALGYVYDTDHEVKFLLSRGRECVENEYCLDDKGNFVAGVIQKSDRERYAL